MNNHGGGNGKRLGGRGTGPVNPLDAASLIGQPPQARELLDNLWSEEQVEDQAALRWRQALLRLSETFLDAAEERRDLSPILLGALHNALEQLLIHGNEDDLMALEEWLGHEAPPPSPIEHAVSLAARAMFSGAERRNVEDRRAGQERRLGQRRLSSSGRRATDEPSSHS